jgi:feruloyl esterase
MDCFTSAQLAALQKIYSGPSNSNGQLYPGFLPCGAEDYPDLIGWSFWFTDGRAILQAGFGIDGPNGQYVFGEQFLKYFVYDDPTYDLHNFDFETDVRDLAHAARILNATKTNLRHFKALGHKMIMYQGWADPAITPLGTIDYYEEVLERMGGRAEVEKFFRLFMVPGMLHCSGGPGPNVADWLTALENWVEKGIEPDSIMGSSQLGDWTRPLCPYPKVAVYDGSGSIYDASNFTCENPSVLP